MLPSKTLIFRPAATNAPADATPETRPFHWTWVSLEGPDAQDFLQRLTTVAAGGLMQGCGAQGSWLTAQGKFRASFTLWRYASEGFAFEFDAGKDQHWNSELLLAIDQMTFAEKMTLTEASARGALACAWVFPSGKDVRLPAELSAGETLATDDELRFCHHGTLDFGRPWITVWGRPSRLDQWLDRTFAADDATAVATRSELERARIEAVRPWVDREITSEVNPLEAGLPDAVAENKGCYPGQEIIEKIAAIGSPARRLVRLRFESPLPADRSDPSLRDAAAADSAAPQIGDVTTVSTEGGEPIALALVRKTHAREGATLRWGTAMATVTKVAPYTRGDDGTMK